MERAADAIIVLGTALHDRQSRQNAIWRAEKAAELWRQGFAPLVICCGGYTHGQTESEAAFLRAQLIALQVPEKQIMVEEKSTTTVGNAHYLRPIFDARRIRSVVIVSTDYHLPRVKIIFARMYPTIKLQLAPAANAFDLVHRVWMNTRNWIDRWKIWRRGLSEAPL